MSRMNAELYNCVRDDCLRNAMQHVPLKHYFKVGCQTLFFCSDPPKATCRKNMNISRIAKPQVVTLEKSSVAHIGSQPAIFDNTGLGCKYREAAGVNLVITSSTCK